MKKITIELYDDLSDEFKDYVIGTKNFDLSNFSNVGFTMELSPLNNQTNEEFDKYCKNQYLVYLKKFKALIINLIKENTITIIYSIMAFPLAKLGPGMRLVFLCYSNNIPDGPFTHSEGELPRSYSVFEIDELFLSEGYIL